MVVQRLVSEVMTRPVISVTPQTPLQEAVKLLSEHHISGLPVVDGGKLVGELSEQQLMARETGFEAGPYVMLLDSVIYLKNPLQWDKEVHQVLGNSVGELMAGPPPHLQARSGLARGSQAAAGPPNPEAVCGGRPAGLGGCAHPRRCGACFGRSWRLAQDRQR